MPELPEVETIARNIAPAITGQVIRAASLLWLKTLATPTARDFQQQIIGQAVQSVGRRAKYIHLTLSGAHLFIHLRMSGDLLIHPPGYQPAKHDRLVLTLENGHSLAFNDTRKFGRVWLVQDPETVIGGLGPEPLDDSFTPQFLHQKLQTSRRQLKPLLLDQTFLSGLGNIYTDEALHLAGLHPLRISATIDIHEAADLHKAIREVLQTGIQNNGASIDWVYRGGGFQNLFRAYGRTGQPCPVCNSPIRRITVGQRGTHFCPNCQVL